MAIKVIGIDPKALKQVTCPHCASRLEYAPVDTKVYTDYGGGSGTYLPCPVCNHGITLS